MTAKKGRDSWIKTICIHLIQRDSGFVAAGGRKSKPAWQGAGSGLRCRRAAEALRNPVHAATKVTVGACQTQDPAQPTLIWLQSEVGSGPPAHRGLPGFVQHRNDAHAAALAAQ